MASGAGRLSGRVALVTGGARGIGLATARAFLREGARVVVADRDAGAGEEAVVQLAAAAPADAVRFVDADVARSEDNARMVREAEEAFGALHVLFLNAGISEAADDDAESTEEEVFDRTIAVNLKGVFLGCKHGIPALRRAGGGSVIATASFVAVMGAATPQLAYTASKGGVLALARELAVVHAREGIRVNALCPGPLRTELLMKYLDTEAKRQRRLVHVPLGRFGEAEEIAEAVVFLASDESSYVTGSTFLVDGGITAAYVTPE